MQALSTAAPGKVYTIKWMFGLPEVLNIIRNCQIEEGSEIRVFVRRHREGTLPSYIFT